eukprot:TRINITY_DN10367_c0_g1_i2.p1 TRINITY_DN10367_c0_g1~~TRINITY_DN10367_c0_g1_i2.p1  ORF type:complete len:353 (+),score=73.44 TRINITY_DN10367_c0_g1_i2:65-1123(+)
MADSSQSENNSYQANHCIRWDELDSSIKASTVPKSDLSKQQKAARKVYKWLARLSPEERQLVLTDTCPEFTQLLLSLLKSHQGNRNSLLSATPLESSSKEFKVSVAGESAGNTAVHEMLLSEVRLFTNEVPLDSITVSHKLVDDVQFLMDCFRCVSNEQCFQFPCVNKNPAKSKGRKKVKESGSIVQSFPLWFFNTTGCTIYQWIEAFFEYLIMKRYQIMNIEGEAVLFERYMSSIKKLFKEHNNLCAFWEGANRPRLIQHFHTSLGHSEDQCFNFLLYAALNATPTKFVDSLYFSPLNAACSSGAHVDLAHGKVALEVLEAVKTQYRDLSLIHICRCRRYAVCRSRWSPYH